MNKPFKNKLVEVSLIYFLSPILFFILGFFSHKYIEEYKLVQTARVSDTSEFVRGCKEIWSKVYAYEDTIDMLDSAYSSRWFHEKMMLETNLKSQDKEIETLRHRSEQQLDDLNKITTKQKFVVGDKLVIHFRKYIGLVKARSKAKNDALNLQGYNSKFDSELIDSFNKLMASMRFDASAAREYAIEKMP